MCSIEEDEVDELREDEVDELRVNKVTVVLFLFDFSFV
jgi:hypothetical protein